MSATITPTLNSGCKDSKLSFAFEIIRDQGGALVGEQAGGHFGARVQQGGGEAGVAAARVRRAPDEAPQLRPAQRSGAHRAGLHGHVEGAFVQVFAAQGLRGGGERLGDGKERAAEYHRAIERELDKTHLHLHPKKCRVAPAQRGFKWLGFRIRIKPSGKIIVTLNKDKIYHERRKLKRMVGLVKTGKLPRETADASLQCWAAHAKHGNNHMVINKMYSYYRNLWRDLNV